MKKMLFVLSLLSFLLPSLCFSAIHLEWEEMKPPPFHVVYREMYRTPVPHGWLVFSSMGGTGGAVNAVFIPDERHEWMLSQ